MANRGGGSDAAAPARLAGAAQPVRGGRRLGGLLLHHGDGEQAGKVDTLAQWKKFWGSAETGSREGRALQGRRRPPPDGQRTRDAHAGGLPRPFGQAAGVRARAAATSGPTWTWSAPAATAWQKTLSYQQWRKATHKLTRSRNSLWRSSRSDS